MDALQRHFQIANHESAHATALFHYGIQITEIDIDRPDCGVAGWVKVKPLEIPDHLLPEGTEAVIRWLNSQRGSSLNQAIASRAAASYTREPWDGKVCESDRRHVRALAPAGLTADAWEIVVGLHADELVAQPWFTPVARALSAELRAHEHVPTTGARAFAVLERALAEFWRERQARA